MSISRESRPAEFPLLVGNRTPAEEAEEKLWCNVRTCGRGGKQPFFICILKRAEAGSKGREGWERRGEDEKTQGL